MGLHLLLAIIMIEIHVVVHGCVLYALMSRPFYDHRILHHNLGHQQLAMAYQSLDHQLQDMVHQNPDHHTIQEHLKNQATNRSQLTIQSLAINQCPLINLTWSLRRLLLRPLQLLRLGPQL